MAFSVAISAGEASGDFSGACLARELRLLMPDIEIWGAGGPRMQEAGVDVRVRMTGGGTIGIAESLKTVPGMLSKYLRLRGEMLSRRPDMFVPIDFGAFNIRLAQTVHKNGIGVVYYFPPSSWRRRPRNAGRLLACGGRVITPFPWSRDRLCEAGVDARYVGHPLVDVAKPTMPRAGFLNELEFDGNLPVIGLLPGSRSHEIGEHLAPMIGCARIMHRELGGAQFVIGAATGRGGRIRSAVKAAQSGAGELPPVRVLEDRTYDCMAHSDFLIAASGTATLEAAIIGTPMIIVYKGTAIMRFEYLFRKSVLENYIGMPNIVADHGVCPELINEDVTPEKLADISLGLMRDGEALAHMKSELAQVRELLGGSGAIRRVAETLLEMGGLK